jgi:hypothetical protein
MKLRNLIAFLLLLLGLASLTAVAYLTWWNIAHEDGWVLWLFVILLLAGVPLVITWWKDLVSTKWPVVVSFILAAASLVVGFILLDGILEYGSPWHAFMPEEASPLVLHMTTEEYLKNMPPPQPVWPKIAAYLLFMITGPAVVTLIYKGSLFCLRSLDHRTPRPISQ